GEGEAEEGPRPASGLLPEPKELSEADRVAFGNEIAEQIGATKHVEEARAKLAERPKWQTHSKVSEGGYLDDNGKYIAERAKLHEQIRDELFSAEKIQKAKPAPDEPKTMIMLGGRGGSGKSWITKEGPAKGFNGIVVDADYFKSKLPEYQGWNAGQLHEESDRLVSMAQDMAMELGLNIVHDATM